MALGLRILESLLYLLLGVSAFFFGSVFPDGYLLLAALSFTLLLGILLHSGIWPSAPPALFKNPAFFWLCAWIVFLILQLVPFPFVWAERLSPNLVKLLARFYPGAPFSLPRNIPLTFATNSVWTEVLKQAVYLVLFGAGFVLFREKEPLRRFSWAVIIIGLFLSFTGLIFDKINPQAVYGTFLFRMSKPFTPYLNRNHFANYLVMTLPLILAQLFLLCDHSSLPHRKTFKEKVLWFSSGEATRFLITAAIFIVELTALLVTASRGAILGLAAAFSVFWLLWGFKRRSWITPLVFWGLFAAIAAAGIYEAKPLLTKLKILSEMPGTDDAIQFRLLRWKDTLKIFFDFPIFGIGAGVYHELFPMYKSIPEISTVAQTRFFYAENEYVQMLAETGITGVFILTGLAFTAAFPAIRKWLSEESITRQWLLLGLFASAAGMLVHSFFDFNMHIPANMALFAVMGGILAAAGFGSEEVHFSSPGFLARASGFLMRAVVGCFVLFVVFPALWKYRLAERHYQEADKHFSEMKADGEISNASLRLVYEQFLKAKSRSGEQTKINYGLGEVSTYFGILLKEDKTQSNAWFDRAELFFQKAIQGSPIDASYHNSLGWLYDESGRSGQAELSYRKAVQLEPQNALYRFRLAQNQLRLGKDESAREFFRQTLKINEGYLEPVLQAILRSSLQMSPADFYEMLPETKRRGEYFEWTAHFFEREGDPVKAATLRAFASKGFPHA